MTADQRDRKLLDFVTRQAPMGPSFVRLENFSPRTIDIAWHNRGRAADISIVFRIGSCQASICSIPETTRTLREAVAFSALYRAVVDFAAMLEVYATSLTVDQEENDDLE